MRISILVGSLLTIAALVSAVPAQSNKGGERTIIGYISDGMCGLDHKAMNMGEDKECATRCAEGGAKFAIADQVNKVVYFLDDASQQKARELAGRKVSIRGRVDGKARMVFVTKMEPAK